MLSTAVDWSLCRSHAWHCTCAHYKLDRQATSDWHKLRMTETQDRAATSVIDLFYMSIALELAAWHTLIAISLFKAANVQESVCQTKVHSGQSSCQRAT